MVSDTSSSTTSSLFFAFFLVVFGVSLWLPMVSKWLVSFVMLYESLCVRSEKNHILQCTYITHGMKSSPSVQVVACFFYFTIFIYVNR